jgi:hypothetical protein
MIPGGTRRDQLLNLLRDLARQGEVMPTNPELADMLGMASPNMLSRYLADLVDRGDVRLTLLTPNTREVVAADGSWRLASRPYRGAATTRAPQKTRPCLKCGVKFTRTHPGQFQHPSCFAANGGIFA